MTPAIDQMMNDAIKAVLGGKNSNEPMHKVEGWRGCSEPSAQAKPPPEDEICLEESNARGTPGEAGDSNKAAAQKCSDETKEDNDDNGGGLNGTDPSHSPPSPPEGVLSSKGRCANGVSSSDIEVMKASDRGYGARSENGARGSASASKAELHWSSEEDEPAECGEIQRPNEDGAGAFGSPLILCSPFLPLP